jgi:hypothetical protein
MALFMGVHNMGSPMPAENLKASWEAYKAACTIHNCKPVRSHMNASKGKAFCLTEAASEADVQAAHAEAKVPVNEIIEVEVSE